MRRTTEIPRSASLAALVAPEDLRHGDFVTILNVTRHLPSFLWCCAENSLDPHEPVRLQCPSPEGGIPFKVKAICLPFVFLHSPTGEGRRMDIRQIQLVRLDVHYAEYVWRQMKKQSGKVPEVCEM